MKTTSVLQIVPDVGPTCSKHVPVGLHFRISASPVAVEERDLFTETTTTKRGSRVESQDGRWFKKRLGLGHCFIANPGSVGQEKRIRVESC